MNSINTILNHIVAQSQIYFNLAKNKILELTPLQQKVAAVALVAISSLTLIYLVSRCCCSKAKRIESEETKLQIDLSGKANFQPDVTE